MTARDWRRVGGIALRMSMSAACVGGFVIGARTVLLTQGDPILAGLLLTLCGCLAGFIVADLRPHNIKLVRRTAGNGAGVAVKDCIGTRNADCVFEAAQPRNEREREAAGVARMGLPPSSVDSEDGRGVEGHSARFTTQERLVRPVARATISELRLEDSNLTLDGARVGPDAVPNMHCALDGAAGIESRRPSSESADANRLRALAMGRCREGFER